MSSVMKNNPLYGDVSLEEAMEERKKNPSWTIEEYNKHSVHSNLSGHLKVCVLRTVSVEEVESCGSRSPSPNTLSRMQILFILEIVYEAFLTCFVFLHKPMASVQCRVKKEEVAVTKCLLGREKALMVFFFLN